MVYLPHPNGPWQRVLCLRMNIPQEVEEASILTNFAWEMRYPGVHEPVTREEYQEALHQAEQVPAWAGQIISG